MGFIARIYYDNEIYSMDLTTGVSATIGNSTADTLQLNAKGLTTSSVKITDSKKGIVIKGKKLFTIKGSRVFSDLIAVGKQYKINTSPEISIAIHPKQTDSNKLINVSSYDEINIGRDEKNDIVLANRRTSSKHCKIYKSNGKIKIKDLGSTNGTYVNNKRIIDTELNNLDIINMSIYIISFENNMLSFYNTGNDMTLNIEGEEKNPIKNLRKSINSTVELEYGQIGGVNTARMW